MTCKQGHSSKLPKVSKKRGNTSKNSKELKKKRVVESELELSSECDGNLDDINESGDILAGVDQIGTSVIKLVKSKNDISGGKSNKVPKKL